MTTNMAHNQPLAGSSTSPVLPSIPSSEDTLLLSNPANLSPENYALFACMSHILGIALPSEEPQAQSETTEDQSENTFEYSLNTNFLDAALALDLPPLSTSAPVHAADNTRFVELSQDQVKDAMSTTNATQINNEVPQCDVSGTETISTRMLAGSKRGYDAIDSEEFLDDEYEDDDGLFGDESVNELSPAAAQTSEGHQAIFPLGYVSLPQAVGSLRPASVVPERISMVTPQQSDTYTARPVSADVTSDLRSTTALQGGSGTVPLDNEPLLPLDLGGGGPVPVQSNGDHAQAVPPTGDQHAHYPIHSSVHPNTTPTNSNVYRYQPSTHYPAHQVVHTNTTPITNISRHHPATHLAPQLMNSNHHPYQFSSMPARAQVHTHHASSLYDMDYDGHLRSLGVTCQPVSPQQSGPGAIASLGTQFTFQFRVPVTRTVTQPLVCGGPNMGNGVGNVALITPSSSPAAPPASADVGAPAPIPSAPATASTSAVPIATSSTPKPALPRDKGKSEAQHTEQDTQNKENEPLVPGWKLVVQSDTFRCLYPDCEVSFTGEGGTKRHIQTHLNQTHLWNIPETQKVQCGFPGCKTLAKPSSHGRHIQETHFKNMRFVCLGCNENFTRKGKLTGHWDSACQNKRANKRRRTNEVDSQ